jgi:hypothetical protein
VPEGEHDRPAEGDQAAAAIHRVADKGECAGRGELLVFSWRGDPVAGAADG